MKVSISVFLRLARASISTWQMAHIYRWLTAGPPPKLKTEAPKFNTKNMTRQWYWVTQRNLNLCIQMKIHQLTIIAEISKENLRRFTTTQNSWFKCLLRHLLLPPVLWWLGGIWTINKHNTHKLSPDKVFTVNTLTNTCLFTNLADAAFRATLAFAGSRVYSHSMNLSITLTICLDLF